jgi:chemotaxis protein MotB
MSVDRESPNLPEHENVNEDVTSSSWFITYLDIITILLIFFVMLLANSSLDVRQIMMDEIPVTKDANALVVSEKEEQGVVFPVKALNERLLMLFNEEINNRNVELLLGEYETRLVFTGSSFYDLGEAELLPVGKEIIIRFVNALSKLENQDFKIDVEGHTDSAPIKTLRFRDNWELSSARAAGVVKFFLKEGIPSQKLKASGYADAFMVEPDVDAAGNFIPEKQNRNRRIVIRLYYD